MPQGLLQKRGDVAEGGTRAAQEREVLAGGCTALRFLR